MAVAYTIVEFLKLLARSPLASEPVRDSGVEAIDSCTFLVARTKLIRKFLLGIILLLLDACVVVNVGLSLAWELFDYILYLSPTDPPCFLSGSC